MSIIRRFANLFHRSKLDEEIDVELRSHIEMRTADNIAAGMSPQEARRQAVLRFGSRATMKERVTAADAHMFLYSVWQDLRYGLRALRKSPGFTAAAVLTLALGIGANTAIFSVINSVLLSTLPVKNPQQLVFLTNPESAGMGVGQQSGDRDHLTYQEYLAIRDRNSVFSGVLAIQSETATIPVSTANTNVEDENGPLTTVNMTSGNYFDVLGVRAILGRTYTSDVDRLRDANPVAVISYSFWQDRFGGAASAVGSRVTIRRTTFDIIGVAPPNFFGLTVGYAPDIWVPLTMQSELYPGYDWLAPSKNPHEKTEWLEVVGRLNPGVTLAQANASVNVLFQRYLRAQIGSAASAADRRNFLDQQLALSEGSHGASVVRGNFEQPLLILMGVVALVLLIACANVANLLLARAASRQKEIAMRVALGGGRLRLLRQLLTESILLALAGGALGLFLASLGDAVLLRLVSAGESPVPLNIHANGTILAFTLGVSLLTGVLFGLVPACRALRLDLNDVLKGNSRGVAGAAVRKGRVPIGKVLVVGQVAISLLLLIVAGLLVRSFQKLSDVNLGYDRDHLLIFGVNPQTAGYQGGAATEVLKEILDRLRAIPGVRGATLSDNGLMSGTDSSDPISIEGYTPKAGQKMHARFDEVGPNFFTTIGTPILMGRDILPRDSGNGQRVGLINQTMARYFFGNESPLGRRIWDMFPASRADFVVVGVVADSKHSSLRETPTPRFYVPFFDPISEETYAEVIVHVQGSPAAATPAIRQAVKQAGANLPPVHILTINDLVERSLSTETMITKLAGFFGALAVLLACIGIYGIMAYATAGRTNEIGVRMALGAQRNDVLWLVLRETLLLVGFGVVIGLPAVMAASRVIRSQLFGLTAADPLTLVLASTLMFGVAALACYIPARRAMRVDPMVALRYE
ncbi:MAG TPA: ABC transporter permease [Candidatus Acidoferrales bacterium]|nr:ABC transporter permease [Candidatus Acidoferrales bacterium]